MFFACGETDPPSKKRRTFFPAYGEKRCGTQKNSWRSKPHHAYGSWGQKRYFLEKYAPAQPFTTYFTPWYVARSGRGRLYRTQRHEGVESSGFSMSVPSCWLYVPGMVGTARSLVLNNGNIMWCLVINNQGLGAGTARPEHPV